VDVLSAGCPLLVEGARGTTGILEIPGIPRIMVTLILLSDPFFPTFLGNEQMNFEINQIKVSMLNN